MTNYPAFTPASEAVFRDAVAGDGTPPAPEPVDTTEADIAAAIVAAVNTSGKAVTTSPPPTTTPERWAPA